MITTEDYELLRLVEEIRSKTGWPIDDCYRAAGTILRDVRESRR